MWNAARRGCRSAGAGAMAAAACRLPRPSHFARALLRLSGTAAGAALACVLVACAAAPGTGTGPGGGTGTDSDGGDEARLRALSAAVRSRPVVLLGEVHDNAAQHALRARALRALLSSGARPALLMEQFDRERQADIDRALARPGASADEVVAAGAPPGSDAARGWDWPLYRPYVELAIEYRLPLVAANVSRADARRAVAGGLAALGLDANVPADVADAQAGAIAAGHCGMIDAEAARPLVAAQAARDQYMAGRVEAHAARGAVLLAGNGHVRADIGVPRWLAPATRARSVAIGLLEEDAAAGPALRAASAPAASAAAPYDVAIVTPAQPRPDPCEALRGTR